MPPAHQVSVIFFARYREHLQGRKKLNFISVTKIYLACVGERRSDLSQMFGKMLCLDVSLHHPGFAGVKHTATEE
jgi:hypothetical protein